MQRGLSGARWGSGTHARCPLGLSEGRGCCPTTARARRRAHRLPAPLAEVRAGGGRTFAARRGPRQAQREQARREERPERELAQGEGVPEGAALAERAVDPDATAVAPDDGFGDGEAKAGALLLVVGGAVDALEFLEERGD